MRKIYLIVAIVGFFLLNIAAGFISLRFDLTEEKLYTLSPGTEAILKQLKEPIELKLFFSGKLATGLPSFKTHGERVREFIEAYVRKSAGKLKLEIIDPEPFSEAEDLAVEADIRGLPLDASSGRAFYLGLSGKNAQGKTETISHFEREKERFLEYDLTKLIYNLSERKRPVLGIIGMVPFEYGPSGVMSAIRGGNRPYVILSYLQQLFAVKILDKASDAYEIPAEVSVLMIAHPRNLSLRELYAIDQFVIRGGRVMLFVDPLPEWEVGSYSSTKKDNGDFDLLLKAWGIEIDKSKFVADHELALQINSGDEQSRRKVIDYPAWISLGDAERNLDDVVTSELSNINMATAGSIKIRPESGMEMIPLLLSTPRAELLETSLVKTFPEPEQILLALKGEGKRHVLAARLSGVVKTAFPDGPPALEAKEGEEAKPAPKLEQVKVAQASVNLIVVADTDLLDNRFWMREQDLMGGRMLIPFASNADFVINGLENLSGSNDLISLRGRSGGLRPFEVVNKLRREAERRFLAREQELQENLGLLKSKLTQGKDDKNLDEEQKQALENFRQEMVNTRKELRDVQRNLNRDIDDLYSRLKFLNIALTPILVVLAAIFILRRKRHGGNL